MALRVQSGSRTRIGERTNKGGGLFVVERVEVIQDPVLHLAELAVFWYGMGGGGRGRAAFAIEISHGIGGSTMQATELDQHAQVDYMLHVLGRSLFTGGEY